MDIRGNPKDCLAAALRLLARRDHSRWELTNKLVDRGFPQDQITWALSECSRLQYQDDERFAEAYTDQLLGKGYGCHRIKQMLRSKGLASGTISSCLENCCQERIQLRSCRQAMLKKLKGSQPSEDSAQSKERLYRFLLGRGYSSTIIRQAMDEGMD